MQTQLTTISGELSFITVYASGWGMGKVKTDGGFIAVTGEALNGLKRFGQYEFSGQKVNHPKYGESIKVNSVQVFIPDTEEAITRYLIKNYSGIGEKTAKRFVSNYLEKNTIQQLRETIINNPFAIDFTSVTKKRIESKDKGGIRGGIYRQFATRLGGHETSDAVFRSLAAYYAVKFENDRDPIGRAWDTFVHNPYAPIRELSGYGFSRADVLGRKLHFPRDAAPRIASLATYALDEGCHTNGHTYLTLDDFAERIEAIDPTVDAATAIHAAKQLGEPIVVIDNRYYGKKYFFAEKLLATHFAHRLLRQAEPLFSGLPNELSDAISKASQLIGITLDPSQRQAVTGILSSPQSVHTVCGNPGCGKTAIMEVVVNVLSKKHKLGFCAPTGKAAKVLSARIEKIGGMASTIHSMLGVGEKGGFAHRAENLLPYDVLVIDETSMVDVALMYALVNAVREDCHLIFLGDSKQLPSIGPGNCLENILTLPFDHHVLTKTHRNQGGLLEVIQLAGEGQADFSVDREDVVFFNGLPEPTEKNIAEVLELYDEELKAMGGDFSLVGLLIARRKGDVFTAGWNITYLNHVLREKYNGSSPKIPGTVYRVGDRIILRKNLKLVQPNDDSGFPAEPEYVVNGDTGYIRGFELKTDSDASGSKGTVDSLTLELDDGRELSFPATAIECLGLAYAMTVHAAQGSEYQRVIVICVNGPPNFIHRGILFTAWSRAQEKLTIIGNYSSIVSILKRPTPVRNTFLVEQTHQMCNQNHHMRQFA